MTGDRVRVRNVYPFAAADREMLAAVDPRLEWVHEGEDTPEWADALVDQDVECLSGSYPPATAAGTPSLRWLATASAGLAEVIARDPWSRGMTVTNGSGLHAVAMSEYLLAGVLLASERLEARLENRGDRAWGPARSRLSGRRLRGRRAVIVGYGSVGREAARLLASFGVAVTAVKREPAIRADVGWREAGTGDPEGRIPDRWAGPGELASVVRDAHHVLVTAPGTPETRGIISAEVIGAMRPDAWIHSVGRGTLIDQGALLSALSDRRIAGAVLDVTEPEPLPPDDPLWSVPGCLVTPHVSGLGDERELWHQTALLLGEQLRRYLGGHPLLNVTSPTAGY